MPLINSILNVIPAIKAGDGGLSIIKTGLLLWLKGLSSETVSTRVVDSSGEGNRSYIYSGAGLSLTTNDYIGFGDQGTIRGVVIYVYLDSDTEPIIEFNGSQSISVTSNVISGTGITSPTFIINGVETTTIPDGEWVRVAMMTETAITASAVNAGKVSSSYMDGDFGFFAFLNTTITVAQELNWYLNPEQHYPSGLSSSILESLYWGCHGNGGLYYDEVGGNHATNNGGTWITGLPDVPQPALMSWNKVSNLCTNSESLGDFTPVGGTPGSNTHTAPDGDSDADSFLEDTSSGAHILFRDYTVSNSTEYHFSVFVKSIGGRNIKVFGTSGFSADIVVNGSTGAIISGSGDVVDWGDGWYQIGWSCTTTTTTGRVIIYVVDGTSTSYAGDVSKGLAIWGQLLNLGDSIKPYIATTSVAISDVLLPEGLTADKDILGFNSIEVPRVDQAFNLDGNSYISVPDDASMDSCKSFGLWVRADSTTEEIWEVINASTDIAVSGGTISATGFTSPTIYVNDSVSSTLPAGEWKMITVTTSTGINVGAMKIGMVGSTGFVGQFSKPKVYSEVLDSTDVETNFNAEKSQFGL